jgi:hypothetical protein
MLYLSIKVGFPDFVAPLRQMKRFSSFTSIFGTKPKMAGGDQMENLAIAMIAGAIFGCSANHETTVRTPDSVDTVSVDGNEDGMARSEESDFHRCLREEGGLDEVKENRNPNARKTCVRKFQGGY